MTDDNRVSGQPSILRDADKGWTDAWSKVNQHRHAPSDPAGAAAEANRFDGQPLQHVVPSKPSGATVVMRTEDRSEPLGDGAKVKSWEPPASYGEIIERVPTIWRGINAERLSFSRHKGIVIRFTETIHGWG